MTSVSPSKSADLEAIIALIAHSPIVDRQVELQSRLADWQNTRLAEDVDQVILSWLASHRRSARPVAMS